MLPLSMTYRKIIQIKGSSMLLLCQKLHIYHILYRGERGSGKTEQKFLLLQKGGEIFKYVQKSLSDIHCPASPLSNTWASLVVQWLRIRLATQGTPVQSLVWEDPTCGGATKPVHQNDWARSLEPTSHSYWVHTLQLLRPVGLEPVLRNKGSHHNEQPTHLNQELPQLSATREGSTQQRRPKTAKK